MSVSDEKYDINKLLNAISDLLDLADENATTTTTRTPRNNYFTPRPDNYNYYKWGNVESCIDCIHEDELSETLYYIIGILSLAVFISFIILIVMCCRFLVCKTRKNQPNIIVTPPIQPFQSQTIPYNNFFVTNPNQITLIASDGSSTVPQPAIYHPPEIKATIKQYNTTI